MKRSQAAEPTVEDRFVFFETGADHVDTIADFVIGEANDLTGDVLWVDLLDAAFTTGDNDVAYLNNLAATQTIKILFEVRSTH